MEKLLVAAVMAFTLGIMVTVEADRCLCPVKHPQQKFCNSDFVFVATVRGAQEANGYLVYDLKVSHEKVFKGEQFVDRAQKYIKVFTSYNGLLCGRPNLVYLEKYLISGVMIDGHMEISYCDWVTEWENITPSQLKYLKRGTYANQCDSCTIGGVYSAHNLDMNENINTYHESQLSGKWSRHGCTYNPVASVMFMNEDCETQYAYCAQDVITGSCVWKSNDEYNECFNIREATWALHHPKQAAFTRVRQCRELTSRRLKKKCLKAVLNYKRSTGAGSAIGERRIPN